jgi:hypothetical protein
MERNVGRSDIMVNTEMVGLHTIKQNGGTPYRQQSGGTPYRQQTLKQWGLFFLALNGKKCWKIRYYGKY